MSSTLPIAHSTQRHAEKREEVSAWVTHVSESRRAGPALCLLPVLRLLSDRLVCHELLFRLGLDLIGLLLGLLHS